LDKLVTIILTSTVASAAITALFNFFMNRKENSLKYVTNERQLWREEIRNISSQVYDASICNISSILCKLKGRINGYGLFSKEFIDDYHIWEIINDIEIETDYNIIKVEKKYLVIYLSLLLKYDWERAKKEVKGKTLNFVVCMFAIIEYGLVTFIHYFAIDYSNKSLSQNISTYIFSIFGFIFIPWILAFSNVKQDKNNEKNNNKDDNKGFLRKFLKIYDLLGKIVGVSYFIILVCSIIIYTIWELYQNNALDLIYITLFSFSFIIYGLSYYIVSNNQNIKYYNAVKKIYTDYQLEKENTNSSKE
jgi:hypothetical protein